MQVFRVCEKEEVDKILSGVDFKNIGVLGKMYKREPGEVNASSHTYEDDERYMHFFPKFGDLFYINMDKGRCVCTYDIPDDILDQSAGFGEYMDLFTYSFSRKVVEYCVNSKMLSFEFLKQVDLITHSIDYMDFLSEEPLDNFLETLYLKENVKHK